MITETRRAVLTALKSDALLTTIVPTSRIYGDDVPSSPGWPFMRWDGQIAIPIAASCVPNKAEVRFAMHVFAKARLSSSKAKLETASDYANRIATNAHRVIHRKRFEDNGATFGVRVASRRSMRDGAEADAWHVILNCVARVIA